MRDELGRPAQPARLELGRLPSAAGSVGRSHEGAGGSKPYSSRRRGPARLPPAGAAGSSSEAETQMGGGHAGRQQGRRGLGKRRSKRRSVPPWCPEPKFQSQPQKREKAPQAGPSRSSGGGIRTRDLRVMRTPD